MKESTAWGATILTGLLVLIISIIIFPMFPQEMAMPNGFDTPVYAFEFAQSQSDLIAIFGGSDDPHRPERILAMDQGNRLDFVYMAIYSAFIASFFYARHKKDSKSVWLVFTFLGLLAGIADVFENLILLGITADLDSAANLSWLKYPVHIKFMALYLCCFGVGMALRNSTANMAQLFGVMLQALTPVAIVLMFIGNVGLATLVISMVWITQLVLAIKEYRLQRLLV